MAENSLIIFVKNLVPGLVKTRLAKDIGIDLALDVYMELVRHTHKITRKANAAKNVYYSEYVEIEDIWENDLYEHHVQRGNNLGERMKYAFEASFASGAKHVVIVGSDCYELKTAHIDTAFEHLKSYDVVVGPATDGGFYLLGMNAPHFALFENKTYGHDEVLKQLLDTVKEKKLKHHLLDPLNDIDVPEDLKGTKLEKLLLTEEEENEDGGYFPDEF
jgi:uncharacterized protein